MDELLDYLAKAEGIEVHRNENESDITAPYGIYRSSHPNAEIFDFIDEIASMQDIYQDSKYWTTKDIMQINTLLHEYKEDVKSLAIKFYEEDSKGAHLDEFPKECRVAMFSMYVNSPLLAWKSVQSSINAYNKNNHPSAGKLIVDGIYGKKTSSQLSKIMLFDEGYYFEALMLLNMSRYYARLSVDNPERYLIYLNGWNNRLKVLSEE